MTPPATAQPQIQRLVIKNYRALRDIRFDQLSPLTVLLGPNGSGKSTVFDVFAFLHEAFSTNLRRAWDRRNRIGELRSRGASDPISIEIAYRETKGAKLVTYRLDLDEERGSPVVVSEKLRWTLAPRQGRPKEILSLERGSGTVVDEITGDREQVSLDSPDLLGVSALGQFASHPRVAALRRFISGWYLSYLSPASTRSVPESGPQRRLSSTGDNLPNVIQYLSEQHPEHLDQVLRTLAERVPQLERVYTELLADGRLLLRFKDAPFDEPMLSKYASDGTLKLLAYLTVFYDPQPPPIVGIEEPENHLHPRLLSILAEEARLAAQHSQLLVTTHSPYFIDALEPREVWVLYRGTDGYARTRRLEDVPIAMAMRHAGASLGHLWMEGYFGAGDPLTRAGRPQ